MSALVDKRSNLKTPPVQERGKGWGLSENQLKTLKDRAREMRNNPTEPEKLLWRNLSNRHLGGHEVRQQEVIGRAIVDFCCPSARLAVEVDGDTHADPDRDARRDAYLHQFGLAVMHFRNEDMMRNVDGVLQAILAAVLGGDSPHPIPSPEGEGLEPTEAQKLLAISLEGSVG